MTGTRFVRRTVWFVGVVLVASFVIPAVAAASQPATVFGPEQFTRAAGSPTTVVRQVTVPPAVEGPFTLTIDTGEPDPQRPGALINAAKGMVWLNGVRILGPGDFGTSHIERSVTLLTDNVLEIRLIGGAGGHLTLGITGVFHVVISAITPDNGPVGTGVLINGAGFDPIAANNQVSFNGAAAEVVNATTTAIETIVPPNATTGPITVTTPNGSASSSPFTVTAANQLLLSKSPDQATYSRGQPITINALLVDGNGHPVPNALITLASTPAEDSRTGDTFIYHSDGTFTITATGEGGGQPAVTASATITVQGAGATITCAPQFDNRMIDTTPGASLTFAGSVTSVNGISQFTVNGAGVAVDANGNFASNIVSMFGVNTVEMALIDDSGLQTRQLCSFIVSDQWVGEQQLNNDSVMLRMAQAALDDNSRAGAINSMADLLGGVVNSALLLDTLDTALSAANPLKPLTCDESISIFGSVICVRSSGVNYTSSHLPGPNTASLTLVNSGMMARVRFEDPRVRLRVHGEIANIPYDVSGDVLFDFVEVDVTFDTGVDGAGRPNVSVRANSVAVRVGAVQALFPGLDGAVLDTVISIANGQLRNIVANVLRDFVVNNFNAVLDGLFSSLDVIALPPTFTVPRLGAGAPLAMNFGVGFSSLSTNATRVLLGIATRFTAAAAQSRPSFGTAVQGATATDPNSGGRAMTEAFHQSLRGHSLHAMWRAGYFDTILSAGALNGVVPSGTGLTTIATLPPVPRIRSDARTEISLGGMRISLEQPALFADPLQGDLAGRVSCNSQLTGDAVVFDACTVDEFHFVAGRPLDAATAAQVEGLLTNVLNAILITAAGNALPALPVPAFTLPASLASYGLPAAGHLGLVAPSLGTTAPHQVVRGNMGIR